MDEYKVIEVEETEEGFTILELLNAIKKNIILLFIICTGFVALGVIYTQYIVTPMYTSSIDLQIHIEHQQTSGTDSSKTATVNQVTSNIKEYIKFPDVIIPVIEENNLDRDVKDIKSRISSSALGSSAAVKITYEDPDPEYASLIVSKLAEELTRRINLDSSDENSLKFATETVKLINYPEIDANQAPSSPNKMLNIIISLLLGSIVGVVIVILKEQFSNHFSSKKDVEQLLKLPVIALIPSRAVGDENV